MDRDDLRPVLDVLVNNAGTATVARQGYPPSQTSLEDMRAVYEINVFGVAAVTNAMLPLLRQRASRADRQRVKRGRLDHRAERPGAPASARCRRRLCSDPSSKAALNMITAMYAKELRGHAD